MEYIFLVVAGAWTLQFLLSYWQLKRFHQMLADMRRRGRCAVGLHGNRWRGRTYGVLVVDAHDRVRHAAVFTGWTVFSRLAPVAGLDGMRLEVILADEPPIADIRRPQWLALQNAAQFLQSGATTPHLTHTTT